MANASRQGNAVGLLDDLLEAVTRDPKTFLIFVTSIAGIILSTPAMLIAILTCIVLKLTRLPLIAFAVIGLNGIIIAILWAFYHIDVHLLFYHNKVLWWSIFRGNQYMVLHYPKVWVYAAPYGFCLGGILRFAAKPTSMYIEQHRKALAKADRHIKKDRYLSDRKIQQKLNRLTTACQKDGTILGVDRNTGETIVLSDSDANLHTLVVGTTGCGKTTALTNLMESTIIRHIPLFYVDGKGDLHLAEKLKRFAEANGVPYYHFFHVGS